MRQPTMNQMLGRGGSKLKHKKTSMYVAECWDDTTRARVADEVNWYNATPYAHLTVAMHLRQGAPSNWHACEQIVASFRRDKSPQKSDPQFRFFVEPDVDI